MAARLACIIIPGDTAEAEILPPGASNKIICRFRAKSHAQRYTYSLIVQRLGSCGVYYEAQDDGVYCFFGLIVTIVNVIGTVTSLLSGVCNPKLPSYQYEIDEGYADVLFNDVTDPIMQVLVFDVCQAACDERLRLSPEQWQQFAARVNANSMTATATYTKDGVTLQLADCAAENYLVALEAVLGLLPL